MPTNIPAKSIKAWITLAGISEDVVDLDFFGANRQHFFIHADMSLLFEDQTSIDWANAGVNGPSWHTESTKA